MFADAGRPGPCQTEPAGNNEAEYRAYAIHVSDGVKLWRSVSCRGMTASETIPITSVVTSLTPTLD